MHKSNFVLIIFLTIITNISLFFWLDYYNYTTQDITKVFEIYLLIPIIGSIYGFINFRSKKADRYRKGYIFYGRSISIGLASWSIGSFLWLYYNLYNNIPVPTPSPADFFYIWLTPCITIAVFNLLRLYNENPLEDISKISPYMILLIINAFYFVFKVQPIDNILEDDQNSGYLKLIYNSLYTTFDSVAVCICSAFVLGTSFKKMPVNLKKSIITLYIGVLIYFFADLFFTIYTSIEESSPNYYHDGHWVDLTYCISLSLITLSLFYLPEKNN